MDYAKTAIKVRAQLAKAGQTVTLTRINPDWYDPETSSVYSTTDAFTGPGVALDYSQREIDGTAVQRGDQRAYLDPLIGATPQTGDTLTLGGEVFQVVTSRPLAPGGVVVLHEVQLRR